VLGKVLEPPAQEGVASAVQRLQDVGALYQGDGFTFSSYFELLCYDFLTFQAIIF
jgi:precorrin-2 methylase